MIKNLSMSIKINLEKENKNMNKNMKILIIPIGPPGCGKTSLGIFIKNRFDKVFYTNRDEEYKKLRDEGNGSRKTRRILYDNLMDFYKSVNMYDRDCIIYMDSVNGIDSIRKKFVESMQVDKIIYINFLVSDCSIGFLLDRTMKREGHPTFPLDKDEQLVTIKNVMDSIDYMLESNEECNNNTNIIKNYDMLDKPDFTSSDIFDNYLSDCILG